MNIIQVLLNSFPEHEWEPKGNFMIYRIMAEGKIHKLVQRQDYRVFTDSKLVVEIALSHGFRALKRDESHFEIFEGC